MIETLFVAPKGCTEAEAMAFARRNLCGLELETFLHPRAYLGADTLERIQAELVGYGGPLSLHGPVIDLNPVSLDPDIAETSRRRYEQAIDIALTLGARFLVFHNQWSPIYPSINAEARWVEATAAFYSDLIESRVRDTPLTLLLENFLDPTPGPLSEIVNMVGSPYLRACLDIGHVNLFSSLSPQSWFDHLGDQVGTIHLHNNDGRLDEHVSFEEGTLDIPSFIAHVNRSESRVQLMVEVKGLDGVERSLDLLRPLVEANRPRRLASSFLI